MKKAIIPAKTLLLVAILATTINAIAHPGTEEAKKYHINIVKEGNGSKEVIDRTFTTRQELDAFVKENKIDVPEMAGSTTIADEKMAANKKEKKKVKKVIIIGEKQEGNSDKTQLNITSDDLTPQERATLIQELMTMKGSQVQMKQVQAAGNSTQGKMVVIEQQGYTGKTEVSITSDQLTAEERANIIQQMISMKGTDVEIKQESGTTSASEIVSALQLSPNPNRGQFHLSFKTGKLTDVHLRMIDINGREVYTETIRDNNGAFDKDINLRPAISGGSYVLEAVASGQKITTQVVVQ